MRNLTEHEVRRLVDAAIADVEAQIIFDIKTKAADRVALLSQLDVLTKTKERIDARIEYDDPLN